VRGDGLQPLLLTCSSVLKYRTKDALFCTYMTPDHHVFERSHFAKQTDILEVRAIPALATSCGAEGEYG
jgi:hypothetical protein